MTPAELERLAMLCEEANEIGQIINKTIRHGYESYNPNDISKFTNRQLLESEIGDLLGIMDQMIAVGDLDKDNIELFRSRKWSKTERYRHHQ